MMTFGVFLTGLAFILMSRVDSLWQFYLSIVLLTIGMSFGTFIVIVATTANWFSRLRSRSLAVLMSASAIGGMAVPIVVLLIDSQGWRDALMYVGIGFWLVGFPAAFAMRWRPEDYGQMPDGVAASGGAGEHATLGRRVPREMDLGVRQALRTRFFWQLTLAVSLAHMAMSASLLHIPALVSFGITRQTAGMAVLGVSASSFVGRLGAGFLGDYVDKRLLIAGAFALMVIGIGTLASVSGGILDLSPGIALPLFSITYGFGFRGFDPGAPCDAPGLFRHAKLRLNSGNPEHLQRPLWCGRAAVRGRDVRRHGKLPDPISGPLRAARLRSAAGVDPAEPGAICRKRASPPCPGRPPRSVRLDGGKQRHRPSFTRSRAARPRCLLALGPYNRVDALLSEESEKDDAHRKACCPRHSQHLCDAVCDRVQRVLRGRADGHSGP